MKNPKTKPFKPGAPRSETLLDKTTRLAREIIDDDAEQRRLKTEQLRKARLAQGAGASAKADSADSDGGDEEPPAKTRSKP